MKRFENAGRWCEVDKLHHTFFEDIPCYAISGRGDYDFYLGGLAPLAIQETHEGWTIWYRPADDNFDKYSAELARLDTWHDMKASSE